MRVVPEGRFPTLQNNRKLGELGKKWANYEKTLAKFLEQYVHKNFTKIEKIFKNLEKNLKEIYE